MGNGSSQEAVSFQEVSQPQRRSPEPGRTSSQEVNTKLPNKTAGEIKQPKPSGNTSKPLERKPEVKLPHDLENIIKDADSPVDRSSVDKLYDQLLTGVFLSQKKRKYWVDSKDHRNCFMLYAKDFAITWSDELRYWRWISQRENSDEITVAELVSVCWLEVIGKFNTTKLTPGTLYEVAVVVLLEEKAYGWGVPVNLRLVLPDGTKQEHKECLAAKPKEKYIEIPVGEFKSTPEHIGDMEISMFEYEGGYWKKGLIFKGALIRPKTGI